MIEHIKPNKILSRYIKNYTVVEINSSAGFLKSDRVFPTGNSCLVFHYGTPSKFNPQESNEYIEPTLVVCGQQTSYYDLSLSGNTGMILITFKPHGLKALFSFPARELQNENLALELLLKNEANILEGRLLNSISTKERINHLETFLLKRLSGSRDYERIDYAIQLIENSKGQISTQKLSQEACLGIKQFERIFSAHVGLTPKKFSGIIRFRNVIQMKNKNQNLYQLAYDNGYYDQSHFIHDFKSLTGLTPRVFFKEGS